MLDNHAKAAGIEGLGEAARDLDAKAELYLVLDLVNESLHKAIEEAASSNLAYHQEVRLLVFMIHLTF